MPSDIDPKILAEYVKNHPDGAEILKKYKQAKIALARRNPDDFIEYVMTDEKSGEPIKQADVHREIQEAISMYPQVCIWSHPSLGKALALDTPIPTPNGWTTMGEIKVGDSLYSSTGEVCVVTHTTPYMENRPTYSLEFGNGDRILADAEHLWAVYNRQDIYGNKVPQVISTKQLFLNLKAYDVYLQRSWAVKMPKELYGELEPEFNCARIDNYIFITKIEPVEPVPVRCITVNSPDHTFLCGKGFIPTHNCEVTGASILHADGSWKPIESIKEEVDLLTIDPFTMEQKVVRAGPAEYNGKKSYIKIKTETDREVQVTEEHPLFTLRKGWVPAREVTHADKILCVNHTQVDQRGIVDPITPQKAMMLGALAQGWQVDFSYHITSPHDAIRSQLRECARVMEWDWDRVKYNSKIGWRIYLTPQKGCKLSPLAFLEDYVDVVKKSEWDELRLKNDIFYMSDDCVKAFLAGFFGTNQYASKAPYQTKGRTPPYCTWQQHRGIIKQIQRLLLRVGVTSTHTRERIGDNKVWSVLTLVNPGEAARFWPTWQEIVTPPAPVRYEKIAWIEEVKAQQDTWALPVHDSCHCYISDGIVSHNTNQVAIGRLLYEIGKDPNISAIIVSRTRENAQKVVHAVKSKIEESEALREVFPHMLPGDRWSQYSMSIQRDSGRKDPTLIACGAMGKILAARADLIIMDDLDDLSTTSTPLARKGMIEWVESTLLSRFGPSNPRVIAIGNSWDEDDVMHSLAKREGWVGIEFPLINAEGEVSWPEKFTPERIETIKRNSPLQFQRLYMLRPLSLDEARFKPEWIDIAVNLGQGLNPQYSIDTLPPGCKAFTGVDLGVRTKKGSDPSAITTFIRRPDGVCELVYVETGVWGAPEIADRIEDTYKRYQSHIYVESNGAQDFLVQILAAKGNAIPVKPFFTGKNKNDPAYGVESLAAELANGKWVIPSRDGTRSGVEPEIKTLIEEMLVYHPAKHTGDILMSLWIGREASREIAKGKAQVGRVNFRVR